jgi:L-ornithine N5-oxygenase
LFAEFDDPRIFHTSHYLSRADLLEQNGARRWLVVGSGQSASDTVADLLNRAIPHRVDSVHRSSGFKLSQFGQFPNLMYAPERVDYFHKLDPDARQELFSEIMTTNYAGIDISESQSLYSIVYEDEIMGTERLKLHVYHEVVALNASPSHLQVTLRDLFSKETRQVEVDGIILATGYRQPPIPPVLSALQPWLPTGRDGGLIVDRNYKIAIDGDDGVCIFANGQSERTHGISDAQSFSLMALRSERILQALMELNT